MLTNLLGTKLVRNLRYLHSLFKGVALAITLLLLLNTFVISISKVDGSSMYPTLNDGDVLIVCKICSTLKHPRLDQIIIIQSKNDDALTFVKRIEGVPGETVSTPTGNITLNKNQYYALGDNRDHSIDSRTYGPIDTSQVLGVVLFK